MNNSDKFWYDAAGCLRRKLKVGSKTAEEAQKALEQATPIPYLKEELEAMLKFATSDDAKLPKPTIEPFKADDKTNTISPEQAVQLYRNQGESDAESDLLEEQLRKEMLAEENGDDQV